MFRDLSRNVYWCIDFNLTQLGDVIQQEPNAFFSYLANISNCYRWNDPNAKIT